MDPHFINSEFKPVRYLPDRFGQIIGIITSLIIIFLALASIYVVAYG